MKRYIWKDTSSIIEETNGMTGDIHISMCIIRKTPIMHLLKFRGLFPSNSVVTTNSKQRSCGPFLSSTAGGFLPQCVPKRAR